MVIPIITLNTTVLSDIADCPKQTQLQVYLHVYTRSIEAILTTGTNPTCRGRLSWLYSQAA